MSRKKEITPSLRQQIKEYQKNLYGEQANEFRRVLKEEEETKSLKAAFVAAKDAATKAKKEEDSKNA